MKNINKSKEDLINELAELEVAKAKCKQTEEAIRESEERYRALFEQAVDSIIIIDTKTGKLVEFNEMTHKNLGYTREEFQKLKIPDFEVIESTKDVKNHIEKIVREGTDTFKTKHRTKGGEIQDILVRSRTISIGERNFIQSIWHDITDRMRAEKVQASIYKISEDVHSSRNLEELYRSIHTTITKLMPAENNFHIALYDETSKMFDFPYFVDEYEKNPGPQKLGKGLTEYVLRTGKPLLAPPEVFEELEKRGEVVSVGPVSIDWLGVPLKTKNKTIGIMVIQSYVEGIRYDEEDKNMLTFISTQVAAAIEAKRIEEELKSSEERLKIIFEFAPDAYFLSDLKGTFVDGNKKVEEIIGYRKEELIGKNYFKMKLLSLDQIPKATTALVKNVLGNPTGPDEFILNRKDGTQIAVEIRTYPVKIKDQALTLCIARDITDRKGAEEDLQTAYNEMEMMVDERTDELVTVNEQLRRKIKELELVEEKLIKAKETAEVSSRAKSDFLASMSHELRTPLNAIIGFSEIMKDQYFGKLNKKQSEYIKDILESGKHLLTLVNDVLDLSKIEADKMELKISKVNVTGLLKNSMVIIKEKCQKHEISLDLHIPKELTNVEIMADERKLKQIMFNLLSNAAKFTPDGGSITLAVRHLSLVNGLLQTRDGKIISSLVTNDQELMTYRNYLEISVEDTGIGIAVEHKKEIFKRFYQVKYSPNDMTSGTGLGLSLAKRLVEALDGRIWVESKGEGKGSRFSFALPFVDPLLIAREAKK